MSHPNHYQPNTPHTPMVYVQAPMFVQSPPQGLSVASMVLGLVSIFFGWTFLVPLLGLILGLIGLKKEPAGKGMSVTGVILNGLMITGWVLLVMLLLGVGMFGTATAVNGTA